MLSFLSPYDTLFVEKLNEWALRLGIESSVLIIAGSDQYLISLSKRYNELLPTFKLTFPDYTTVKKVIDKSLTYEIAEKINIPVPKSFKLKSLNDLLVVLENNNLLYPMLLKAEESSRFYSLYKRKSLFAKIKKKYWKILKSITFRIL